MTTSRTIRAGLLIVLSLGLGACTVPRAATDQQAAEQPIQPHNNLNGALWVQTSVEYRATAQQAYELATLMLDRALADASWTASLEQSETDGYDDLPPAVVLDVDETVLDNSPYQARLILDGETFNRESWQAWIREEKATPVPGALGFTRYASRRGVRVFYLTNRRYEVEEATRRNLAKHGFPLSDERDVILTRGEEDDGATSDKTSRRQAIADDYRILLLVGDNFGDFASDVDTSIRARDELARAHDAFWGTRWIVLPNPQYGSWEGALYNFDYERSPEEILDEKYEHLDPAQN